MTHHHVIILFCFFSSLHCFSSDFFLCLMQCFFCNMLANVFPHMTALSALVKHAECLHKNYPKMIIRTHRSTVLLFFLSFLFLMFVRFILAQKCSLFFVLFKMTECLCLISLPICLLKNTYYILYIRMHQTLLYFSMIYVTSYG